MSVAVTTTTVSWTANGIATTFGVPFKFVSDSDLIVTKTPPAGVIQTLVLGADYSVTGAGSAEGVGVVTISPAVPSGTVIAIERLVLLTQPTSFVTQGPFTPATVEACVDRLTLEVQDTAGVASGASVRLDVLEEGAATLGARVTVLEGYTPGTRLTAIEARLAQDETAISALSGGTFTTLNNTVTALQRQVALQAALANRSLSSGSAQLLGGCATGFASGAQMVFGTATGTVYYTIGGGLGTWSTSTAMSGKVINDIASSGSLLVAVGENGGCATSPDGVTWTTVTGFGSYNLRAVVYAPGMANSWCIISSDGGLAWVSANGISWSAAATPPSGAPWYLAFGNGTFVAFANDGLTGNTHYWTSVNGNIWLQRTLPVSSNANVPGCLFFSTALGSFFASFYDQSSGLHGSIYSSPEGVAWLLRHTTGLRNLNIGGNSNLLIAGDGAGYVVTCTDGNLWTRRYPASTQIGAGKIISHADGAMVYLTNAGTAHSYADAAQFP